MAAHDLTHRLVLCRQACQIEQRDEVICKNTPSPVVEPPILPIEANPNWLGGFDDFCSDFRRAGRRIMAKTALLSSASALG